MLTVLAPAKLNLTLEVTAERSDGYHEVRSVLQTVNLCDSLHFHPAPELTFSCGDRRWRPEASLVSRAAALLREETGIYQGASVEVEKRIPLTAGLGGDSSDAAAALRGFDELWELGLGLPRLLELAAQLGSDVPFFLHGGTVLATGRGEVVTPLPPLPRRWVVLVLPPVLGIPRKTVQLYACLRPGHYTGGQVTDRLAAKLAQGEEITDAMLFNVFESVAPDIFDGLDQYREQFLEAGAVRVHLAGSGPALFTLAADKALAGGIYDKLQRQGLESYIAETGLD